ncbi:MAG TPA: FAD-binding oxidoreductase [Pseudonocardiaceae bacterium]
MIDRRSLLRGGAALALTAGAGAAAAVTAPAAAGRGARRQGPPWDRLRTRITGDVVLPGDAGYDSARRLQLARYDGVRPSAVLYAETPADVRDGLLFAQNHDLPLAVRSGGHNYAGWSTGEGMVLDVSRLNGIRRTDTGQQVVIGAGAQTIDVLDTLTRDGVAAPGGMCADIGSGGYFSVGGTGLQTRMHGIASDRVTAARVVLADGRVVRCSRDEEPDLFWALRGGGGGNFGVVTAWRVRTFEVGPVHEFTLVWSWDDAAPVLTEVQGWMVRAPRELAGLFTIVVPDAAPGVPPDVVLNGVHHGDGAELERLLDELVGESGRTPVYRDVRQRPFKDAMMGWYGCEGYTVEQCHRVGQNPAALLPRDNWVIDRGRLLDAPVPAAGVDELLAAYDRLHRSGEARLLWLMNLGGAANDRARGATAYVHRGTELLMSFVLAMHTPTPSPEHLANSRAWAAGGFDIIDRYGNGESYVAFPDLELTDWRESYYAENYPRLVRVKRAYDPYNFFRFGRSIGS